MMCSYYIDKSIPTGLGEGSSLPVAPLSQEVPPQSEVNIVGYKVKNIREMNFLFNQGIPVIFLGGQMGTMDEFGKKQRVEDRDALKQFCEDNKIYYYDPESGQPENPAFSTSRATDKTALLFSAIDVLSIGKESMAGVSVMEALFDYYLDGYPQLEGERILYFPDATSADDIKFDPPGIVYLPSGDIDFEKTDPQFINMYFEQALRTGNLLRSELLQFTKDNKKDTHSPLSMPDVQVFNSETQRAQFETLKSDSQYTCLEIDRENLQIDSIVRLFSQIFEYGTTKKFAIYLAPPLDTDQIPIMADKDSFSEKRKQEIVQQFITEGNSIRKLLLEKLKNDPHTTLTFTQEHTKQALLARYKALLARKEDQKVNPNYLAL